ncbi:MAG: D-alanyl-D-alanine carboxypeptidase [Clostridia bacterium]|nr:D-alanyl-D-alanine carboxypeptidase [Clostridia bacterium]
MTGRGLFSSLLCLFLLVPVGVKAAPGVSAKACVVLEPESGRVLYQKNAQTPMAMASTTKIMTALTAIEHSPIDVTITVSNTAAGVEGSSMYLQAGEKLTLEELLYGLMLASGNDAAVAIAEHFGGVDAFVEMMNQKAKELGVKHTRFANPNGLPDENHYSTAEDMARLTAAALKNPDFARIVATKTYRIEGEGKAYPRVLTNHNKLLRMYEGCIGVKTGFTKAAGRCLVSAAQREDMTLICVTLHAPDDWNDHQTLYNHLFSVYRMEKVVEKGKPMGKIGVSGSDVTEVSYGAEEDVSYPVAEGETLYVDAEPEEELRASVELGQDCGRVRIRCNQTVVKTVSLVALQEAQRVFLPASVRTGFRQNLDAVYRRWLRLFHLSF